MGTSPILHQFKKTGALLDGHFLLSSGLHSPTYLQCALALQNPKDAAFYGAEIVGDLTREGLVDSVTVVASPAIGGLVIGFAVAQVLGVRFMWTERQNGEMILRRGFSLSADDRVLVVEDVITTGGSTRECIAALTANNGKVVAAASIIDRSNGASDVGVPRLALLSLDIPTYGADDCPMCKAGSEPIKPGSRTK